MENVSTLETRRSANAHAGVIASARANLERVVDNARANAGPVLRRIGSEVPEDAIASASEIDLNLDGSDELIARVGDKYGTIHDHAFGQLVSRFGMPVPFSRELRRSEDSWKRDLLVHNLREFRRRSNDRFLVRSVGQQHRAFLSDRFRRLDSRPLLQAFADGVESVGGLITEGVANDVRVSVRAIVPKVIEPVPGEPMVMGLTWNNSDYGSGKYSISFFAMRLVCLNGMVGQSQLAKTHLGGRLDDNIEYSKETYDADTRAMTLATTDSVKSLMSPKAIDHRLGLIRKAHDTEVNFPRAFASVRKNLLKGEAEAVKNAFESKETIMLPPGNTKWRFSNALSWVANSDDTSPERKMELQGLAAKAIA